MTERNKLPVQAILKEQMAFSLFSDTSQILKENLLSINANSVVECFGVWQQLVSQNDEVMSAVLIDHDFHEQWNFFGFLCSVSRLSDCLIYQPVFFRDLKESDANGFVQRAISAANVYNNIVKYVDDANITSLTTFNLSQRAEDVCLIMQISSINFL